MTLGLDTKLKRFCSTGPDDVSFHGIGVIPKQNHLPMVSSNGPATTSVSRGGTIPASLVEETRGGVADREIPVDLNSTLMDERWDLILNLGHVVPHEVL